MTVGLGIGLLCYVIRIKINNALRDNWFIDLPYIPITLGSTAYRPWPGGCLAVGYRFAPGLDREIASGNYRIWDSIDHKIGHTIS